MKKRLITSALPYVNNIPHLGNLIQCLSADVFARFCRLRGYETLYVCGSDEYGTATETRAMEEGISPRELCDRNHEIHKEIYAWFNIAFDHYGRTSTKFQTDIVQNIFRTVHKAGYIAQHSVKQLYSEKSRAFLADRYVRGTCPHCGYEDARGDQCENCGKLLDPEQLINPTSILDNSTPVLKETTHFYIKLPELLPLLEKWMHTASTMGKWARNALTMTQAWIRDGLKERAITRDLKWGIPVPLAGFEDKVFYVWFDAPIGYISITAEYLSENEVASTSGGVPENEGGYANETLSKISTAEGASAEFKKWWQNPKEVELFQFIGKDNIPFHTVIFPACLLATGENWTMLHHISSSEYMNYEGGKFSKSKGLGVFGTDARETGIPADLWRFYTFYNRPETGDYTFTWKDFQETINKELIGNFANLVNRCLRFYLRYFDAQVNAPNFEADVQGRTGNAGEQNRAESAGADRAGEQNRTESAGADRAGERSSAFWKEVEKREERITELLEWAQVREALREILALSNFANKTFQEAEPWKLRVDDPASARSILSDIIFLIRDIALLLSPFIPETSAQVMQFLSADNASTASAMWADLRDFDQPIRLKEPKLLLQPLDDDAVAGFRERYSGKQSEAGGRAEGKTPLGEKSKHQPKEQSKGQTEQKSPSEKPAKKQSRAERIRQEDAGLSLSERFAKRVELRVATIRSVEKHPNADSLYIEELDDGSGNERRIVSGLVRHYSEAELLGRNIILVANLKPAKLRGVLSEGMLLAASASDGGSSDASAGSASNADGSSTSADSGSAADGSSTNKNSSSEIVDVIFADHAQAGDEVHVQGFEPQGARERIDIESFFDIPIRTENFALMVGDSPLKVAGQILRSHKVSKGAVG